MALAQGPEGATAALKPGSTIPLERTQDALDLNVLLNGFKPVFEALNSRGHQQVRVRDRPDPAG